MTTLFNVRDLVNLGRVGAVIPSPCSTWAAVEVAQVHADGDRYITGIWRVSLTDKHTKPVPLTDGAHDASAPCFRCDGALGFLSNPSQADDPATAGVASSKAKPKPLKQIWCITAPDSAPTQLTDEPLGVASFKFATHGDHLVWCAARLPGVALAAQRQTHEARGKSGTSARHYRTMPVRFWDKWLGPAVPQLFSARGDGTEQTPLTPDADIHSLLESSYQLSPKGDTVALAWKRPGIDRVPDGVIRLIDTGSGAVRTIGDLPRINHEHLRFSPDGTKLVCARHQRRDGAMGPVALVIYDLNTGSGTEITHDWVDWPEPFGWTADGQAILIRMQINGRADVLSVPTNGQAPQTLLSQDGCHDAMHRFGDQIIGRHHSILAPPAPFIARLDTPSARTRLPLPNNETTSLDEHAQWQELTVIAKDGAEIQSFVITPNTPGPHPVLFWVHGGPISHFADWWHWRWNPLVFAEQGYAVVMPNPRGSRGFGGAFIEGIWNNQWGDTCFDDLMRVADALNENPALDTQRMSAMGASFGGYMMNWFGGQTDRFKAIICHAGIFDISAFYGATDLPAWWNLQMGGNPYSDPEHHDRYSPHRFVQHWTSPTLIIHGEKDYRCPIDAGLALFEALQLHGVDAELLVFPDENHWIQKPANIVAWHDAILAFLKRIL